LEASMKGNFADDRKLKVRLFIFIARIKVSPCKLHSVGNILMLI